jgi:hypothetical protein
MLDHVGFQCADIAARAPLGLLYPENYYGTYVRDPDGNNVEAVSHRGGE